MSNENLNEMNERRPLPMGRQEFHEWADRIIIGARVTGATEESLKWTLANLILHLGPTESHKEDAYFIHSLRKFASHEVAATLAAEFRAAAKARLSKEQQGLKIVEGVNQLEEERPSAC